jgi:hypothetical protein
MTALKLVVEDGVSLLKRWVSFSLFTSFVKLDGHVHTPSQFLVVVETAKLYNGSQFPCVHSSIL